MDTDQRPRMRQVVDWSAALWAGLLAGTAFWLMLLFFAGPRVGATPFALVRIFASIVLDDAVLDPPADFHPKALAVALGLHYAVSISFAVLTAVILHRWGLFVGVLGGAAIGFALYCINGYLMQLWFPQFIVLMEPSFLICHLVFGALAGGIYELLEVEEFELVEAA